MTMSNLSLVIQREYLERVRKKSFIITTILMPVLMLVLMFAPVMIMMFNKPDHNVIGVIDNSGKIYEQLKSTSLYDFVILDEPADSAIAHQTINGYIVIPADILDAPSSNIRLLMNGAVPVVGLIEGVTDKIVTEGEDGFLLLSKDKEGFANRIIELAINHERLLEMRKKAMNKAGIRFSEKVMAKNYKDFLEKL